MKKYQDCIADRLKETLGNDTQLISSNRLKCSQAMLSKYLSGDLPTPIFFLANLAREYKVDLNWLLTGEYSPAASDIIRQLKTFFIFFLNTIDERIRSLQSEIQTMETECKALDYFSKDYDQKRDELETATMSRKFYKDWFDKLILQYKYEGV